MDKSSVKKRKKRVSYNTVVIAIIKEKYGYSAEYIRQCLRGDQDNLSADTIKKEYSRLDARYKRILETLT